MNKCTEDETFRILQRSEFYIVLSAIISKNLLTINQQDDILNEHHWDVEEYKAELYKYYLNFRI